MTDSALGDQGERGLLKIERLLALAPREAWPETRAGKGASRMPRNPASSASGAIQAIREAHHLSQVSISSRLHRAMATAIIDAEAGAMVVG